jgi:hypothetical protein
MPQISLTPSNKISFKNTKQSRLHFTEILFILKLYAGPAFGIHHLSPIQQCFYTGSLRRRHCHGLHKDFDLYFINTSITMALAD